MTYKPGGDLITKDGRTSQYVVMGFSDTKTVHADFQNMSALTAFMLIDLSDTTNWKHSLTGHLVLEYLILEVDPDSAFLGQVKFGFLTNVDATNGDFNQILDIDFIKKSDLIVEIIGFGTHGFECQSAHHFGPIIANSTLFQTDVNLEGPDNAISYPSGDGDFALIIDPTAGAVDVSITIGYEAVG